MSFGRYSYGSPEIKYSKPNAKLIVGNFTSIAQNVKIYLGNGCGHDSRFVSTYPFKYIHTDVFPNVENNSKDTNGDVIIGNDVWVGDGTTILSGVTIGDGAVIAANSHIVKNVEPYTIVGGNPATLIKYRFSTEQITKLLEIKWWDWDDNKINENTQFLSSDNIDDFLFHHA